MQRCRGKHIFLSIWMNWFESRFYWQISHKKAPAIKLEGYEWNLSALTAEVFVSSHSVGLYSLECAPSIIRDVIFFPLIHREILPVGCSPSHRPLIPPHFLISFCFLHDILALCKRRMFGAVIRLRQCPDWQSSGITTSNGSHIIFVTPWLLLSNLGMPMLAVSISQSHIWVYVCEWPFFTAVTALKGHNSKSVGIIGNKIGFPLKFIQINNRRRNN